MMAILRRYRFLLMMVVATAAAMASVFIPLPKQDLSTLPVISLRITDRNGETLREVLSDKGGRAYWLPASEYPPVILNATIAAEDARFYHHPGVDPFAIARALWQDVRALRQVSGGSTITQQVVRNIYPIPRTLTGKLLEAWRALRLERTISKQEILCQYLNRVPYGNGTYGAGAASILYFNKPVKNCSPAEAAFLAALPNAPGAANPYHSLHRAINRQRHILDRMLALQMFTHEEYERACREDIHIMPPQRQLRAPHFTGMVLDELPDSLRKSVTSVRTTLDGNLQQAVEALLKGHVASMKQHRGTNGAVVALDNRTGDILALAGSVDYFDSVQSGQVNGALAPRQPGSALKPFLYTLAFECGLTPSDIIPDVPFTGSLKDGSFNPENYDRMFHGPVRLRTALACSYNVPAVRVADRVGVDAFLNRLHAFGFTSLKQSAGYYGLALALGDGEVTLLELARAYAALARGGSLPPVRSALDFTTVSGAELTFPQDSCRQVVSRQTAFLLTSILSDRDARMPAFGVNSPVDLPFQCAVKTGTSKDYKDNWTIGCTTQYTVAVWVGNFDAKPMRSVSGISGAGPLFRDVMLYLHQREYPPPFTRPVGIVIASVCPRSGELPNESCPGAMTEYFIEGTAPQKRCGVHRSYCVDSRTKELAGNSTPLQYRRKVVVERFPPLFDAWNEANSLPEQSSPINAGMLRSGEPMPMAPLLFGITAPEDGAIFKLDPVLRKEYQKVKITVAVGEQYRNVRLLVDGKPFADVADDRSFCWQLEKGEHIFMLNGERGGKTIASAVVHVQVTN